MGPGEGGDVGEEGDAYVTTGLDSPEMMLLSVLLGTCPLGRTAGGVIVILGRVLQLIVAAGTDKDLVLLRDLVGARVAGEASSGRRWGLKVGLGRWLPATVTAKAISLVVEVGRVARERVGVHWNSGGSSYELDVGFVKVAVGEESWQKASDRTHKVAAEKVIVLVVSLGGGRSGRRQTAVGGDVVVWGINRQVDDSSVGVGVEQTAIAAVQGRGATVLGHVPPWISVWGAVVVVVVMVVVEWRAVS